MEPRTIAVSLPGSDEKLQSLARWFRDEDELRGKVTLAEEPIRDGHMGGVFESVVVILTSTTAATFVTSLFGWLSRRREADKVTLTLADGTELQCGSAGDAVQVLQGVRRYLDSGA